MQRKPENQSKVNEAFCTKKNGKDREKSRKDAQKSPCYFEIFIEYFINIAYIEYFINIAYNAIIR